MWVRVQKKLVSFLKINIMRVWKNGAIEKVNEWLDPLKRQEASNAAGMADEAWEAKDSGARKHR